MNGVTSSSWKKVFVDSALHTCLNKCKGAVKFVFWFSSAVNILVLFVPLYTSQVLDRVMSSGSHETLLMLTLITILALGCLSILDVCRGMTMMKIGDWLDQNVAHDLIGRSIGLNSIQSDNLFTTGEVIRDLNVVKSFIIGPAILSMFDIPWALVYLIAIFMIHPFTGLIAVVGMVLLFLMALWNECATKKVLQKSTEENIRNINYVDVAARNSEVVEAMGMTEEILLDWKLRSSQNRELQILAQGRSSVIGGVTKFFRLILQISVIGVGALLVISGHKTSGGVIAASILMSRALAPFENAINTWKMLVAARMSYRRLRNMIMMAPHRPQSMGLPTPEGKVTFERVFFTPHGGSKPTIKGLAFQVDEGDVLAVIGSSGSGKSTMAKLLVGVWKPISGVVRLDGADVYTWDRSDFGKHIGYVPQDVELFNVSISRNIARMAANPDPESVVKAAKIVGVHEMILSFPSGYDTVVGRGFMLSGGQKQLIGLARAMYGNVKLLVLDEPNSSLDTFGNYCLQNVLEYANAHKITTFFITHRLSMLKFVSKILVMYDGMIQAYGFRDEVLKSISRGQDSGSGAKRGGSSSGEDYGQKISEGASEADVAVKNKSSDEDVTVNGDVGVGVVEA